MCKLALDTVRTVEDDSRMKTIDIKRYAHIVKVPGGEIEQSQTLNGIMLNKQTFQSPGCPFKGVGRKCTEPLVYSWAEIYQVPLYTVGPRYINHPLLHFGRDKLNEYLLLFNHVTRE